MPDIIRLRNRHPSPQGFSTVSELVEARLRARHVDLSLGHICSKTNARAHHYLNSFAADYGSWSPSDCGNDELLEWIAEHPEWESPSTRINAAAEVITAFAWASDKHTTRYGSFTRRALRLAPAVPRTPITDNEFRDLQWHAKYQRGSRKSKLALRCANYFMYETGCRTCELFSIERRHIDFAASTVTLTKHKTDATGKVRTIYLTRGARLLLRLMCRKIVSGPIFVNGWRRPWKAATFARLFRRYAKLAGVRPEVSPYSIRHNFCVRSLNANNGDRQTADLMGQSSTHYVKWYGATAKNSVDYLKKIRERF